MGCASKRVRVRRAAWSDGTTTAFFLGAARFPCQSTGSVKVSWDLEGATGDLRVSRAIRYSNDGITWTTPPIEWGSFTEATGDDWGTTYQSTDATYQMCEVGVMVKNDAGASGRQQAQLNFTIDTREP